MWPINVAQLFFLVAFVLFFCLGVGMQVLPHAEQFAFAALALGLFLVGMPWPPWPPRA